MTEIITDPGFATLGNEESPWAIQVHEGILITPAVKDSVLSLDVSKTLGANWHGELRYSPFPVRAGEIFAVSFSARATQPFLFSVWLGQQDEPWKSLVSKETHFGEKRMTPEWQTFTHQWLVLFDEPKARLNFVLGQRDNVIEIKTVRLNR